MSPTSSSALISSFPVSYTHLDVYKRQVYFVLDKYLYFKTITGLLSICFFWRLHTAGTWSCTSTDDLFDKNLFYGAETVWYTIVPVSYTHLDVYKRQHTHTHTHTWRAHFLELRLLFTLNLVSSSKLCFRT